MFTDLSLCPGGAFMMHESVAEFDSNMPENPVVQEAEAQAVAAEFKEHTSETYCPITKVLTKLEPHYQMVRQLLQINLRPEDPQEAVASLDQISKTATDIAECMRMMLVKQDMVYRYMTEINDKWAYEAIYAHLGFFIMNYNRLVQKGYGRVSVTLEDFPSLDVYSIDRALSLYMAAADALPSYPFDINRVFDITNYDKSQNAFNTTEDMFNCFFNDPERRQRLTVTRVANHDLEPLMQRAGVEPYAVCDSHGNRVVKELICHLSRTLRQIKRGCYELQVNIMDNMEIDRAHIAEKMRPLIAGTADLLYLPAIRMLGIAYCIKCHQDTKESVNEFVEQALSAMKTPD